MRGLALLCLAGLLAAGAALPHNLAIATTEAKGYETWWHWFMSPFSGWGTSVDEINEISNLPSIQILNDTLVTDKNSTKVLVNISPPIAPSVPAVEAVNAINAIPQSDKIAKSEKVTVSEKVTASEKATASVKKILTTTQAPEIPKAPRLEKELEPNVTVTCDEQICTSTYCLPDGNCTKKSCNIYETNMKGECQQFVHLLMTTTTTTAIPPEVVTKKEVPSTTVINTTILNSTVVPIIVANEATTGAAPV